MIKRCGNECGRSFDVMEMDARKIGIFGDFSSVSSVLANNLSDFKSTYAVWYE